MLRSDRTSEQFAVLYCDLDGFKLVNDLFGHEAGDSVLREVAARLLQAVRPYDTVTRFGGDEFVILLEDIEDQDVALNIATRIVDAIATRIVLPEAEATIGISVGVAIGPEEDLTPDGFLARADAAMYEAKHAGKGRVELFGQDLDVRLTDRRELGNDLRHAVARGEFELWYRPVASLDTGQIASLEGTVRWNHPTRGLLEPDHFIPIALATGVIEQLDEWVLTTAATDMSALRREHPDLVAWITVSSRLLMRDNGARRLLSILDAAGADARSVGVEVGEASVVHDFAATVAALRELHAGNVCIALDNFCGQLTVPQLHALRPDSVKLDRSLVTLLGVAVQSATEIRSITGMIRPLGISVVAKGVNTREQLAAVISLNCDGAQGALTGDPTRVSDLVFELQMFSPVEAV
jgi:diguanylate cyclase (GGDEF)-like protein